MPEHLSEHLSFEKELWEIPFASEWDKKVKDTSPALWIRYQIDIR